MHDDSTRLIPNLNTIELAWAAGFYDAEGHTGLAFPNKTSRSISVAIKQIHPEVLHRFRDAVGGIGRVNGPYESSQEGHRPQWDYKAAGLDSASTVIKLLWPWLGPIKREQAQAVLDELESRRPVLGIPNGVLCKRGHDQGVYRHIRPSGVVVCRECSRMLVLAQSYKKQGRMDECNAVLDGTHVMNKGWRRHSSDPIFSLWSPNARPESLLVPSINRSKVNEHEAAWAAGFFDGEGTTCWYLANDKRQHRPSGRISLSVPQNNVEPLDRFILACQGNGLLLGPHIYPGMKNPRWTVNASSKPAILRIITILWPHLSSVKRQQVIDSLLASMEFNANKNPWASQKSGRKQKTHCSRGHDLDTGSVIRSGKRVCQKCERLLSLAASYRRRGNYEMSRKILAGEYRPRSWDSEIIVDVDDIAA